MKSWLQGEDSNAFTPSNDPIAQSSPDNTYILDALDNESINEDLQDSINRIQYPANHDTDEENDKTYLGVTIDGRGRTLMVSEEIPRLNRSRSKSKLRSYTPFKIRDNINHLFGWDVNNDLYIWEEPDSKINLLEFHENYDSKQNVLFAKPASRLAILNNEQHLAMKFEINYMKKHYNDFPLYYSYNVFENINGNINHVKVLQSLADNKAYFKNIAKQWDQRLQKLMIFRIGIIPKRKDSFNLKSCSIDMKLIDQLLEFEIFKNFVQIMIDDTLCKPEIVLSVIGIVLNRKSDYSIISIWLYPPASRFDETTIFNPTLILNLVNCIRYNLNPDFAKILETSVLVENESLTSTALYQKID